MKHDIDIGQLRDEFRGVSRSVFSKQNRLEAVAILGAQRPPVWSRQLARSMNIGENQAASELASLAEIGALQRFPAEHDRRKIYHAVPNPIWGFARELLEDTVKAVAREDAEEALALYWKSAVDDPEPAALPSERR